MRLKIKSGEKISGTEFMSRWKKGMEGVTPLQQARITYSSGYISLIGLIAGIIICIIGFKTLWWLGLILTGALGITLMQQLGGWQKIRQLKKVEEFSLDKVMMEDDVIAQLLGNVKEEEEE